MKKLRENTYVFFLGFFLPLRSSSAASVVSSSAVPPFLPLLPHFAFFLWRWVAAVSDCTGVHADTLGTDCTRTHAGTLAALRVALSVCRPRKLVLRTLIHLLRRGAPSAPHLRRAAPVLRGPTAREFMRAPWALVSYVSAASSWCLSLNSRWKSGRYCSM